MFQRRLESLARRPGVASKETLERTAGELCHEWVHARAVPKYQANSVSNNTNASSRPSTTRNKGVESHRTSVGSPSSVRIARLWNWLGRSSTANRSKPRAFSRSFDIDREVLSRNLRTFVVCMVNAALVSTVKRPKALVTLGLGPHDFFPVVGLRVTADRDSQAGLRAGNRGLDGLADDQVSVGKSNPAARISISWISGGKRAMTTSQSMVSAILLRC